MIYRMGIVVLSAFLICMGLLSIRFYFDQKDIHNAEGVFAARVVLQTPGRQAFVNSLQCTKRLFSRYEGLVLFQCRDLQTGFVQETANNHYLWEADIYRNDIKPMNKLAQTVMP
ncbi:MAG: hypothetical protein ACD_62C00289G0005 [uncultured bacterium]|nr:MAG: hypothetical protein ACD_62C00289G0005 [uncultured bacterium]